MVKNTVLSVVVGLMAGAMFAVANPAMAAESAITGDKIATSNGDLTIHPLKHATMALSWNGKTIYVDPAPAPGSAKGTDGAAAFQGMPAPDIILVGHQHGDHFDVPTLQKLVVAKTVLVVPQDIADKLPADLKAKAKVMANGQSADVAGVNIEAVPAYNLAADKLQFHPKGRDNGYVLNVGGKRVYIAGDTEEVPEMLALKNIDVAFIPMNLPYTMTPDAAAKAVLAFKPKIVYPYHYGQSDLSVFEKAIGTSNGIEIRRRNWY